MARRDNQTPIPTDVPPLEWAARGCGMRFTPGKERSYYSVPDANAEAPRTRRTVKTPNVNPFKVRGAK